MVHSQFDRIPGRATLSQKRARFEMALEAEFLRMSTPAAFAQQTSPEKYLHVS
jgi:hypothetical protein